MSNVKELTKDQIKKPHVFYGFFSQTEKETPRNIIAYQKIICESTRKLLYLQLGFCLFSIFFLIFISINTIEILNINLLFIHPLMVIYFIIKLRYQFVEYLFQNAMYRKVNN